MSNKKRFLFGSLGALVPLLVTLVTVEASTMLAELDGLRMAGWLVRVVGMMTLGGVAAWQFSDENVRGRVAFHLGMTWPAVLTASGIGLQTGAAQQQVGELTETVASYASEVDTLTEIVGADPDVEEHVSHLDSIRSRVTVRETTSSTQRLLDGMLGRPRTVIRNE